MMSGCGILTNGKGTRREYGQFNLDELTVGSGSYGCISVYFHMTPVSFIERDS